MDPSSLAISDRSKSFLAREFKKEMKKREET